MTRIGLATGQQTPVTTTYSYDNANRLTGITHSSSVAGTLMTLTYGYDAANQLTSYSGPDGSLTYGYDNGGQLTGVSGAHAETYTYDKEGNRTMTGYTTTIGNRLTADGTSTYAYDNDGNMVGRTRTSDNQVTTYTYDFRNRLTEDLIKTSGGVTVQDDKFTYDVENRRIGKNTLSGGQSWTGYDGVNPYADFNSSGSLTYRYLYGNAIDFLLARVDTSGTPMWYLTDKLGSVREDVSTSGSVLDSITYDSYGNILTESSPSNGDRFKYTSREWDSEIAQYYYRARDYNPAIGRFLTEDPLALGAGDSDLYRYVGNNPVNNSDPLGLQSFVPNDWQARQIIQQIDSEIRLRGYDAKRACLVRIQTLRMEIGKLEARVRKIKLEVAIIIAQISDLQGQLNASPPPSREKQLMLRMQIQALNLQGMALLNSLAPIRRTIDDLNQALKQAEDDCRNK
jgi:RHS repeat-associated protein